MICNNKQKKRTKIVHDHCEKMVAPRGPHMGLWCARHHAYIKFIGRQEQARLRQTDIAWMIDEPAWLKKKPVNTQER